MNPQTYELSEERGQGLFFIDDTIAPTIQLLNQKGFRTSACCSGHNEYTPEYAYIQYDFGEITPEYLPEDWYWCDNGQQMEYQYQSEAGEERLIEIKAVMVALHEWANTLPDTNC